MSQESNQAPPTEAIVMPHAALCQHVSNLFGKMPDLAKKASVGTWGGNDHCALVAFILKAEGYVDDSIKASEVAELLIAINAANASAFRQSAEPGKTKAIPGFGKATSSGKASGFLSGLD